MFALFVMRIVTEYDSGLIGTTLLKGASRTEQLINAGDEDELW